MPEESINLNELGECDLTFVCVENNITEIRNTYGRFEPSSDVELFGYRFRFHDRDEKNGHIGMIFPEGKKSLFGEEGTNRILSENLGLVLEFSVIKCSGNDGCCQPWNNYQRYHGNNKL